MISNKQTIVNLVNTSVRQSSNRLYAARKTDEGWKGYTFRQMRDNIMALAAFFQEQGYGTDHKIAILADGSPQWINCEIGAIFARLTAVPLSYRLLSSEVLFRLDHCGADIVALSNYTKTLGFSVIGQAKKPFKVLWLDDNKDEILTLIKEKGLNPDDFIFIRDAVEKGELLLRDQSVAARLNERLEAIDEDDLAVITYSSGTTGNPKGVMLSHKNLYSDSMTSARSFYSPLNQYKLLLIIPCDHAFGHIAGIYFGLAKGVSVYFADSRGGQAGMVRNIPINLSEVKPDFILVVPALMTNFMKRIYAGIKAKGKTALNLFNKAVAAGAKMYGNGFNRVTFGTKFLNFIPWFFLGEMLFFPRIRKLMPFKIAVGGGALFDYKTQEFFAAIGIPLYQGYGLSEAAPAISSNVQTRKMHKIGTAGKVFPIMDVKILRDDGKEAAPDEIGEITVKGPNVMLGYYKNPEETAKTIIDGVLHTGDMGSVDKDGFLSVVGRGKALLINKEGEKYSPEGMEEAISSGSEIINQALLYCEHKPYTTALISLNKGALASVVKEKLGSSVSIKDALALVTQDVFQYKTDKSYDFPREWQPGTYCLVHKDFDLNSTFKIIRFKAFEVYADELDYMYTPEGSMPDNIRNRIVLKAMLREEGINVSDE